MVSAIILNKIISKSIIVLFTDTIEIQNSITTSKTAKHFEDVLGQSDLIGEYAKIKANLKSNFSLEAQDKFKTVCAKLEVMLKLKEEKLATELKILENSSFNQNTGISVIPKDENQKEKRNSLMNKLKVIKALKKCI